MSDKPRVGVIGLGVMGSRMAGTMARVRYALSGFDADRGTTDGVSAASAAAAAAAGAGARTCGLVLSGVPWWATVRELYLGAGVVVENARPGTILVDTSTVD